MTARLLLVAWALAAGGCVSAGARAYSAGQAAQRAGDLDAAFDHYAEAHRSDPSDPSYRNAFESTQASLLAQLTARGEAREKAEEWTLAATEWRRAADVAPDVSSYAVRRDLSALKAEAPGPYDWFVGVKKVAEAHPDDEIAARSLARAKTRAVAALMKTVEGKLEAGEPAAAVEALDRALDVDEVAVDPQLAKRARSAKAEKLGDEALAKDEPFIAYEHFDRAHAYAPSPGLEKKRSLAKRKAAPIVKKLDRAYGLSKRGRHARALVVYRQVAEMNGAPPSVAEQIAEVEKALIAAETEKAVKQAERGRMSSARRAMHRAIDVAKLDDATKTTVKDATTDLTSDRVAAGLDKLGKVELQAQDPLQVALEKIAHFGVARAVKRAQDISLRNPAKALALVAGLEEYADTFPEIQQLSRSLKVDAFTGTLEAAFAAARRGDDATAADTLVGALQMSEAPRSLAAPIEEACKLLEKGDYLGADAAFDRALVVAPGSRLATWGIKITDHRRDVVAKAAVKSIARGRDDETSLALLEAIAKTEPDDEHVKAGRDALLARAAQEAQRQDDAGWAELVRHAARLTPLSPTAREELEAALAAFTAGDMKQAAARFDTMKTAAPTAKVAKIGHTHAHQRADEEKSAAERRSDRLDDLITQSTEASKAGDVRKALRTLKAAVAVSVSAGPFKRDVNAGLVLITRGEPAKGLAAVKASGLPKKDPLHVPSRAYAIATARRLVDRARRVATKSPERAIVILKTLAAFKQDVPEVAELERAIEVDAFMAQLDEAERHAAAGRDERAAAVLTDALETSRAPPKVRRTAKRGIDYLASTEYLAAERAFDEALAAAPQSKLAERGKRIAGMRRAIAERRAKDALVKGRGDPAKAVETLEASLGLEPDNAFAAEGAQALLARATTMADDAEDEALATVLGYAARLMPKERRAYERLLEGLSKLSKHEHAGAESAFRRVRTIDPTNPIAMLGQQVAKARLLASFESGRVDVSQLDTAMAESLAAMRKEEPDRPEPLAALAELLETARSSAESGDAKTAARMLGLAIVVAGPPPATKRHLVQGQERLTRNDPVKAATAFEAAEAEAPNDEVVKTAIAIAERARLNRLIDALVRGNDRRAQKALEERLASKAGARTKKEIFETAEREAYEGREDRAARLYDALNALTEDAAVKKATAEGNRFLAKRQYDDAVAAYTTAQKAGDAPVAKKGEKLAFSRRVALMFADVAKLKNLTDLDAGAKATQTLLGIDPYDKDGIAALDAALDHAANRWEAKDRATALRALEAAVVASDAERELMPGVKALAANDAKGAAEVFAKAERLLVPAEDEVDSSLKKLLGHQRKVAARGKAFATDE
ncbi:MAG: hypothetical protein RIT81_39270 [Deltaproteobacteria bacterium]